MKTNLKNWLKRGVNRQSAAQEAKDGLEKKRLMQFNRFFSQYKVFTAAYLCFSFLLLCGAVYLFNRLGAMRLQSLFTDGTISYERVSFLQTIQNDYPLLLVLLVLLALGYVRFAYGVRVSYGNLNVGQKGTARWTTREEIERQYKKVPEKDEPFPGEGGFPVARTEHEIYIDNTTVHNLVFGGTRSGKGQLVILPMVDIYSRAEEKASLILTDPKMELANMMMPTLQKRGYECYILNLIDMEYSMGYNPLTLIIDEYKNGKPEDAQQLCAALGYAIFAPNPEERDPFWRNQARNVFVAACMAEIADNVEQDREENLRREYAHNLREAKREAVYYEQLYGEDYPRYRLKKQMDAILKTEPDLNDAGLLIQLQEVRACSADTFPDLPLTETLVRELRDFSYRSSEFRKKPFYPSREHEKKVTPYSVIRLCLNLQTKRIDAKTTALDEYFLRRPESDFSRLLYGDIATLEGPTKGSIMTTFAEGLKEFTFGRTAQLTAENTVDFVRIGFGKKPVAIFLALPDYDPAKFGIATIFISQLSFILAKLATAMPGGKLYRRVHFILDEWGNLPPIENMGELVTVGLGRNILYSLFIQSKAQVLEKYPQEADIILDNCGNQLYLMTASLETAKEVSEKLGNATETTLNRTGKKNSIDKELTEMQEEFPLLSANQLQQLQMGETVLNRYMFRETQTGERVPIKATPIFNQGKYRMHYAHTYLRDVFPPDQLLYRSPNLDRIIEENPDLRNLDLHLAGIDLRKTSHIDYQERSRTSREYLTELAWRESPLVHDGNRNGGAGLKRIRDIFDLLHLTKAQRERYLAAGTVETDPVTGEERVLYPGDVLRNGEIVDYARKLLTYASPQIKEAGFQLMDLLLPLSPGRKTEEERRDEGAFEQMLLHALSEGDEYETEEEPLS